MDIDSKVEYLKKPFFIKSKTNNNEFAKQYFLIVGIRGLEPSLIIRKLILSEDFELYSNCVLLKKYKGLGLFEDSFSIKVNSLQTAIKIINTI